MAPFSQGLEPPQNPGRFNKILERIREARNAYLKKRENAAKMAALKTK
jgi:hypothetical protein